MTFFRSEIAMQFHYFQYVDKYAYDFDLQEMFKMFYT